MSVRPILGSLLGNNQITENEKSQILNYLGGVEDMDEESLVEASSLAENREAVLEALLDIFPDYTGNPELMPQQPVSVPLEKAESEDPVKDLLCEV